jgi:hypothetical protein
VGLGEAWRSPKKTQNFEDTNIIWKHICEKYE